VRCGPYCEKLVFFTLSCIHLSHVWSETTSTYNPTFVTWLCIWPFRQNHECNRETGRQSDAWTRQHSTYCTPHSVTRRKRDWLFSTSPADTTLKLKSRSIKYWYTILLFTEKVFFVRAYTGTFWWCKQNRKFCERQIKAYGLRASVRPVPKKHCILGCWHELSTNKERTRWSCCTRVTHIYSSTCIIVFVHKICRQWRYA